jgi:hypothetical protein
MREIKKRLFEKYTQTRNLLLPTIFKDIFDILPNPELTEKYERLRKNHNFGSQNEWLARFCSENKLEEIEMSTHIDDNARQVLESFVIQKGPEEDAYFKLDKKFRGSDEYELFRFFKFPIFNLSKLDIRNIVKDGSFEDIMNLTWFCHNPRGNRRPCGVCHPCVATIEEGLASRIPFSSRVSYHFRVRARIRKLSINYPNLYGLLRKQKIRLISK